jgi:VanZ family protein
MPREPRPRAPRDLRRFLPPLLWMGLIALGSSSLLSTDRTGRVVLTALGHIAPWASPATLHGIHIGLRKLGHLVEFGVLGVLWHRALSPSPGAAWTAFALAAAYGGVDELRQILTPSRGPALSDAVVDALGAWLGLAAWTEAGPLRSATLRGATWGTWLLAGLAFLGVALEWALGGPALAVGFAALGLGLVAAGLGRLTRAARVRVPADLPGPPPR